MKNTEILKRPLVTEKITGIPVSNKGKNPKERYAFVVDGRANKIQIANAVKDMYGVQVDSVNTINCKGKLKTRFTKGKTVKGYTKVFKKAIVTLVEGELIDLYAGLEA